MTTTDSFFFFFFLGFFGYEIIWIIYQTISAGKREKEKRWRKIEVKSLEKEIKREEIKVTKHKTSVDLVLTLREKRRRREEKKRKEEEKRRREEKKEI